MVLDPARDVGKVSLCCPHVEKVAARVTVVHGFVDVVSLTLQHSDAIIELIKDSQGLVGGCIVGSYKRTVVSGDLGDVAILAAAKFRVVVARLSIGRLSRRGGKAQGSITCAVATDGC